ncbi:MAG: FAD-dependent oxidoreductase [Acidobacteria bacterium]|nr:FAD-dependent oxidoreductase [Acidobacteriota bacterium]
MQKWLASSGPGRVDHVVDERLDLRRGVRKSGNRIQSIRMESGKLYRGSMFLDTSYEGDLMAKAGVDYHWGRESRDTYGEALAGITIPGDPVVQRKQFFPKEVSPYRQLGAPQKGSALLPGISDETLGRAGDGDRKIQAYCFRLCVTDNAERRVAFHKPEQYDPWRYELLARMIAADPLMTVNATVPYKAPHLHHELLPARWLPNRKSDVNDGNPAATDYIGANWGYPEGDHRTRDAIWRDHVNYTQGYLWFIANDPRMPEPLRKEAARYGYDAGEFGSTKHFPPQLYVREGRRMIGEYVVSQKDCKDHPEKEDSIGVASYPVDSHHVQRIVYKGQVTNEGNFNNQSWGIFAHEVPYRAITPKRQQCGNLLVPVCLSSSHVAYGSIRMEPVFMILGQSAALAAMLATESNRDVQEIDFAELKKRMLAQSQILSRKLAKGTRSANLA